MERNRLNTIISRNLLLVRQERRFSQSYIATVLAIKQPSYNRMESGRTHISADQLALLAEFYELPINVFYEPRKTLPNRKLQAFSLTEVLVVLVIIGIITLLALPNLMPLITKAKGVEAKGQLQHAYTLQKNHFYERSTYADELGEIGFEQEKLVTDGGQANYRIEVVQAGTTDFVIRATAVVDFNGNGVFNIWEIDQDKNLRETTKD
ncbi:helix-turn-helix domain-containing protein [Parapedobacter sp. 10938]|uniref:helix-turn-helix domain-containing protein n=1 Tax=Parapedobacter flavus TaxID=3110225 RepID=UPI002DB5645E|nr:helix-turn-helix domain-containing protein [Parapedobacter sp. 10938]MEC3882043.1 helix-turn-helix domain-containing protein [Parapedobacter sp. 10938]